MNVLIVDDELNARETLVAMLGMVSDEISHISMAEGVASGIAAIREFKPDLLFLDIHLGDGTGFDLLNAFPSPSFHCVFVTAYEEYAIKAFKFSAVDYLVKPVLPEELSQCLKRIRNTERNLSQKLQLETLGKNISFTGSEQRKIILKTTEAVHLVSVSDIIQCESDDNYTRFFLADGRNILVSHTLREYEDLLGECGFFRPHNSHLINMYKIDYFDKRDGGFVVMKDASRIPVSYRRKDILLKIIQQLGSSL